MDFKEYQEKAMETAQTNKLVPPLVQYALKLNGEAGEVAEKIGKIYRDHNGELDFYKTLDILYELGDVLWYVSAITESLGGSLENVALLNLEKIRSRQIRSKINGSGDNR